MLLARKGQATPLTIQLFDGSIAKYPVAYIKNSAGTQLFAYNMSHIGKGQYLAGFTPPDEAYYITQFVVYSDLAHLNEDPLYVFTEETLFSEDKIASAVEIAGKVWDEIMLDHSIPETFLMLRL